MSDKQLRRARALDRVDIETEDRKARAKLIFGLTWPALAENVLATLVSMADTMMVSGLGAEAVSAVGLVTQPRFIVMSSFMALGVGTTALVARAKGKGDRNEANLVLRQSMLLGIIIVVLVSIAMLLWSEPLIRWIAGAKNTEQTIQYAVDYFRIQIYGFPVLGLTFIMTAALRGAGNTRAAFYSNTAANIVNVIFNFLLIEGRFGFPRMETAGASLATVIGQTVAFFFCLYLCLNGKQYVKLDWKRILKYDHSMVKRVANIGIPAMGEQIIMRVGMLLFTKIAASLGTDLYATHIIAMNIQSMSFTVGMSFGTASATLTGQCLGRKKPELAKDYVTMTRKYCLVISLFVAAFLFFGGGAVAKLYNVTDPEMLLMAGIVLKIVAVTNPMSNSRFVLNSALRGAGDSRFTAVSTFIGILAVRPLLAFTLVNLFDAGLIGVWIALVSDSMVCFALAMWRWRTGKWATIRV